MKRLWKKLVSLSISVRDAPYPYWWYNIRTFPRECVRGIKNLIRWFPIVWADRWWDWTYLVDVICFKLEHMADELDKKGLSLDRGASALKMREVVEHLRQLEDDCPPDREDGKPLTVEDYKEWDKKLRGHQSRAFYIMGVHMREWWD